MKEKIFYLDYLNICFINSCIPLQDIVSIIHKIKNSKPNFSKIFLT